MTDTYAQPAVPQQNPLQKIIGAFQKDKQDEKLVSWVLDQYKKAKDNRSVLERQWYLNMAFFYGRQNVQWIPTAASTSGFKLYTPPAPPWRVRLVINKVRTIVRTEVSKLTSKKPNFTVIPSSTEDEDIFAARAAQQILDYAYDCKGIHETLIDSAWWQSVCGNGYVKTYWDANGVDYESGQTGIICTDVVSPFHIFVPDLRVRDIEKQPWVIHASTKSKDYVKAVWQQDVSVTVRAATDLLEDTFLSMVGAKPTLQEEVLVLEVWIKPMGHPLYPQGGRIVVAGNKIVANDQSFPYEHGEYPFAKLDHVPSGKYYTSSNVEDLIAPQREYNRTRSQLIENKNRMARPQLIAPEGSVDARKMTSEPGQVIEYKYGLGKPEPMPLQGMPAYVQQELDRLQTDMDDISGQHEISRGNTPSQVTAATAISYLQEQDDTKLAGAIHSVEKAVEKIGRHYIALVKQYWTTDRVVKVVGTDSYFDAMMLKGASVVDANDKASNDVRVEAGSALSSSTAARTSVIMELMKNQLLPPDQGLKYMGIGGLDKIFEEQQSDFRAAQRENLRLASAQDVPVNTWDNHQAHIDAHNRFRKTEQFELLPPSSQALYEKHVTLHQTAQASQTQAQQMDQMKTQMLAQGGSPLDNGPAQAPAAPPGQLTLPGMPNG